MIRITQDLIRTVIYEGDEPVVPTDLARARLVFRVAPSGEVEMLKNTHAIVRVARLTPERTTGGHANTFATSRARHSPASAAPWPLAKPPSPSPRPLSFPASGSRTPSPSRSCSPPTPGASTARRRAGSPATCSTREVVGPDEAQLALAALRALRGPERKVGARALAGLCRLRGLDRAADNVEEWLRAAASSRSS